MSVGEQISLSDLGIWCGKMSPEPSVPTMEKTSELSSKRPQELSIHTPLFLDLRTGAPGLILGVFWQTDGLSLGEYMTHSFGECPKDARESRLSQILEDKPHPKYCLSGKACQGILNRAKKRGKELPKILEDALLQSVSKSEQVVTGGHRVLGDTVNSLCAVDYKGAGNQYIEDRKVIINYGRDKE